MWKCIHCGLEVSFRDVVSEVDEQGYYFVCPACDGRNALRNVTKPGDEGLDLEQDDPPDDYAE
jgi:DNA-directed RNA polymerase subunit RPC12/RpoP